MLACVCVCVWVYMWVGRFLWVWVSVVCGWEHECVRIQFFIQWNVIFSGLKTECALVHISSSSSSQLCAAPVRLLTPLAFDSHVRRRRRSRDNFFWNRGLGPNAVGKKGKSSLKIPFNIVALLIRRHLSNFCLIPIWDDLLITTMMTSQNESGNYLLPRVRFVSKIFCRKKSLRKAAKNGF